MEKFENKKFNIFEKTKELNLPFGKYVIVGSGLLDALGIRPASDIDIAVSKDLYEELKKDQTWKQEELHDQIFLQKDIFTIIPRLNWEKYETTSEQAINSAVVIKGTPFMSPEELLKFKKALNREKDQEDIKLLEKMVNKNK
ncbi:MAG TPA: hypothetical protein PLO44_01100 [Candidatus Paceibacterota bacterium]|nr:hypothetical protein [Candidatus Paceibacterota bacterium]